MDKEIVLLPYEMGGNGMSGNGMSGNGAENNDSIVLSEVEFEQLTKDFV